MQMLQCNHALLEAWRVALLRRQKKRVDSTTKSIKKNAALYIQLQLIPPTETPEEYAL